MTINATGNRMTTEIARQSRLAGAIARSQIAISTGRRYEVASDDPVAAARVAKLSRDQANEATWKGNLTLGASLAAEADTALSALSDHMLHARELMTAGASGTASIEDRRTYATELRALARDVIGLRQTTSSLGTPLFSPAAPLPLRAGSSTVIVPTAGAAAVFDIQGVALDQQLQDAADVLEGGDAMRIGASLDQLGTAITHVADAAADQGVRAKQIDGLLDRNAARAIDIASERSGLEDTDLTTAIAQLNAQQLTLDAAQAAFARINRRSLFDLLN